MPGLYLHIPFCRQACRYCDFYFTVSEGQKEAFVEALLKEARMRTQPGQEIFRTLYLGGGTPSRLELNLLSQLIRELRPLLDPDPSAEWTIECNPDDLNPAYLTGLKKLGFNRLSIGIQSFVDRDLELMRRAHRAEDALRVVRESRDAGFENINLDLIYGIPGQEPGEFEKNLDQLLELEPEHISAYHLSFEEGTVFEHWRKKGKIRAVEDQHSLEQYSLLRQSLLGAGYEHYEISNFARSGKMAVHNSLYWSGEEYLGLGPSAHSYRGGKRSWNPPTLKNYVTAMEQGRSIFSEEESGTKEDYHEYLLTSLRTSKGASAQEIANNFGSIYYDWFIAKAAAYIKSGEMEQDADIYRVSPSHWLISDLILRELFID